MMETNTRSEHIEREVKFNAEDCDIADIKLRLNELDGKLLDDNGPKTLKRNYLYYDTPDFRLRDQNVSLRVVSGFDGEQFRIDLKVPLVNDGARQETSSSLLSREPTAEEVADYLKNTNLKFPVSHACVGPCVCFSGMHEKILYQLEDLTLEFSLDQITWRGQRCFKELEVELKHGTAEAFDEVITRISELLKRNPFTTAKLSRVLSSVPLFTVAKAAKAVSEAMVEKDSASQELPILCCRNEGRVGQWEDASAVLRDSLAKDGAGFAPRHVLRALPQLTRMASGRSASLLARVAAEFGLVNPPSQASLTSPVLTSPLRQAREVFGGSRDQEMEGDTSYQMLASAMALRELGAKPDILVLDDLPHRCIEEKPWQAWSDVVASLTGVFTVHTPPLPILENTTDQPRSFTLLTNAILDELERMPRLMAAIVDMHWNVATDSGKGHKWFGFELIRLLRQLKPTLPIFVWSNLAEGRSVQRCFQLGATYWFDKQKELRCGRHAELGEGTGSEHWLDAGKLWMHIWNWEGVRYEPPIAAKKRNDFFYVGSEEARNNLQALLKIYGVSSASLSTCRNPPLLELLRCVVPDAECVEVLKILGSGRSGNPPPFVVGGRTEEGETMKPVQIKITRNWRALSRERKGYLDVMSPHLGPAISHVLRGPYRIGEWSVMSQSYAAPEEIYPAVGSRSIRTLKELLVDNINESGALERIVDRVFEGILIPLYRTRKERQRVPCHKVFQVAAPPHVLGLCHALGTDNIDPPLDADFRPDSLSTKNEKARREAAYRQWRELQKEVAKGKEAIDVMGLVVDTIEGNPIMPLKSRIRLLDRALGVKIDLYPCDAEMAKRWLTLEQSPLKFSGLEVRVRIFIGTDANKKGLFLRAWSDVLYTQCMEPNDVQPSALLEPVNGFTPWEFIQRCLPLDYAETFRVGPLHGDLNVENILFHEHGNTLFPWLIDFDQARKEHAIVFDLVKLEMEASQHIASVYFKKLADECGLKKISETDVSSRTYTALDQVVLDFELLVEKSQSSDLSTIWMKFDVQCSPSETTKLALTGFFNYVKRLRYQIFNKLEISHREYTLARLFYGVSQLKFKNLYSQKDHPVGAFAAQYILLKTQCSLLFFDEQRGVVASVLRNRDRKEKLIGHIIHAVRAARVSGNPPPFCTVATRLVGETEGGDGLEQNFVRILRLLTHDVRGENRWFDEILWHIRDFHIGEPEAIADFATAMIRASRDECDAEVPLVAVDGRKDFASTGRVANTTPTRKFFKALSGASFATPVVKVSSRGESGGTIDMLDKAGMPIAKSLEMVNACISDQGWCIAEPVNDICGIDRTMMQLRRNAGCMKVDDLVIASISAKKLAVAIKDFTVELVGGYDSKFGCLFGLTSPTNKWREGQEAIQKKWQKTWEVMLKRKDCKVYVDRDVVDSNRLQWNELSSTGSDSKLVVIGSSMLVAQLMIERESDLKGLIPKETFQRQSALGKLIEHSLREQQSEDDYCTEFAIRGNADQPTVIEVRWHVCYNLTPGVSPPLRTSEIMDLTKGVALMRVLLSAKDASDFAWQPCVPFFDDLYSHLNRDEHPLTSILFSHKDQCLAISILAPGKHRFFRDPQNAGWQIIRQGFDTMWSPLGGSSRKLEVPKVPNIVL